MSQQALFVGETVVSAVYIYTLSDPRTGDVRYVGKTNNPRKRLHVHMQCARQRRGRRDYRANWVASLITAGVQPVMDVIETCALEEWATRERFWIAEFKSRGCQLTNANDGGAGPPQVSDATRQKLSAALSRRNRSRAGIPTSATARASWSAAHKRRFAALSDEERRKHVARSALKRRPGWNKLNRTHCVHGHPYNERNTYTRKNGLRVCKECQRVRYRNQVAAR